mmetsp:Transcript_28194/g.43674  ORF Transcript_28194/g.43674 Transcript_28194/m.43674 type:complete len:153 (-) Transcript_28194:125-583(-)
MHLASRFCAAALRETNQLVSRFAEVSIFRMSIMLGERQAFIDFHILPEDAGSLTDSGLYGEATLVLVVADMTKMDADAYVQTALKFPRKYLGPAVPIAVLAFAERRGNDYDGDVSMSSFQSSLAESDGVQWVDASMDRPSETLRKALGILFD